jgi:hypothetical protein
MQHNQVDPNPLTPHTHNPRKQHQFHPIFQLGAWQSIEPVGGIKRRVQRVDLHWQMGEVYI